MPDDVPTAPEPTRLVKADETPSGSEIFALAVRATVELAEIGFSLATHAVRSALARLPRPQ
jgi:hypothetical protein